MAGKKSPVRKSRSLQNLGNVSRQYFRNNEPITSSQQVRKFLLTLGFTARIITLVKRRGHARWVVKGNYPGQPEEFLTVSIMGRCVYRHAQAPEGRVVCRKSTVKIRLKHITKQFAIREQGIDISLIETKK